MEGVRVTVVPWGNEAVQVPPEQVKPAGLLVTLPFPSPVKDTLKERDAVGVVEEKVAETVAEEIRLRTQLPVPVQDPPQPEKV